MPVSPGTPSKKLLNASSPPAEAPMPTTSEGGRLLSQSRRIDPGLVVCPWLFLRADLASPTAPVCRTDFPLRHYTSRLRGSHKMRSVSGCKLPKAPRFRSDFAYFLPDLDLTLVQPLPCIMVKKAFAANGRSDPRMPKSQRPVSVNRYSLDGLSASRNPSPW